MQYWLTSKALWNLGWSTWNHCHTTDQTERCFPFQALLSLKEISLRLKLSSSSFPVFLAEIFHVQKLYLPRLFCVKLKIVCCHELSFKYFFFYTVSIHGFKPPRIILSLVFSGTQGIPTYLKKMCLVTHKQGSNEYVVSLNVLIAT